MGIKLNVCFDVTATVEQTIELNEGIVLTQQELIAKLESGEYLTTISHGFGSICGNVLDISNGYKEVGKVTYQTVEGDSDYTDFRDNPNWD